MILNGEIKDIYIYIYIQQFNFSQKLMFEARYIQGYIWIEKWLQMNVL